MLVQSLWICSICATMETKVHINNIQLTLQIDPTWLARIHDASVSCQHSFVDELLLWCEPSIGRE